MVFSKRFTMGLITGAVVGSIVGMCVDPVKENNSKNIKKSAGSIIRSVGNMIDGLCDMHN